MVSDHHGHPAGIFFPKDTHFSARSLDSATSTTRRKALGIRLPQIRAPGFMV